LYIRQSILLYIHVTNSYINAPGLQCMFMDGATAAAMRNSYS